MGATTESVHEGKREFKNTTNGVTEKIFTFNEHCFYGNMHAPAIKDRK
jgi:hypothetical protein